MGVLYEIRLKIEHIIQERNLEPFTTKGEIGLKAGIILNFIKPDTPDDPLIFDRLIKAVREILNCDLYPPENQNDH